MLMYFVFNRVMLITDEHSAGLRAGSAHHSADFGLLQWKTPLNTNQDWPGRVDRV